MKRIGQWLILVMLPCCILLGQEKELTGTDRPGIGDGASIMETGGWQVELGTTLTDIEDVREQTFGEMVFRYGLNSRFELRVLANSFVTTSYDNGVDDDGVQDAALGFKYNLFETNLTALTFVGGVSLPTGSDGYGSDDPEASGALSWSWEVNDGFSHSAYIAYDDGDNPQTTFSTSVGWGETIGYSVGYGVFMPDQGSDAHFLEANVVFPINPRNQFDVNAGVGLNSSNSGYFAGVGYAYRF